MRDRSVIRAIVAYSVASWMLLQIADVTFDRLPLPDNAMTILIVLVIMGAVREILGQGTLFANLHLLTGLPDVTIHVADSGFLLMVLPPGAFLTLGCLIALKNVIDGAVR